MKRKAIIILVVLAAGVGVTFLVLSLLPEESAAQSQGVSARRGELIETAGASGTIEPHVQVEVKSRASGEVIELLVEEGDEVAADQVLVRLDPRDAEQNVREAEMALTRAQSDLVQARANFSVSTAQAEEAQAMSATRNRGAQLGLISTEDQRAAATSADVARATVTQRQAQVRSSRLSVESAELGVEEAQRRLEEMVIRAPVSGTVLSVNVEIGSIVASGITNVNGGSSLMTIADLSDLRVVGSIDEAQVGQVTAGQDVTIRVDAYPDQAFSGSVERLSPLGQETSNVVTFDVEIMVTDDRAHLLRSGMSADLEIVTTHHEDVVLIPIATVQSRGPRQFVILTSGERRRIITGGTDGTSMVVLEGLEGGETIATSAEAAPRAGNRTKRGEGQSKGLFPMAGGGRGGKRG